MLKSIKANNIALIEKVHLELDKHLNIFSGETGAGKSMLIDSIQFAIGNRTSRQIIRKGQDCGTVEILFKDEGGWGLEYLETNGIPYEDKEICIARALYQSGRTTYKINGMMATRQMVKELSALLIDVHGQHEPQSLLDVTKHIQMLDCFGGEAFKKQKATYKKLYERLQGVRAQLSKIGDNDRRRLQLKDMLSFQINEIASCQLKPEEEEELKAHYQILSHAEKIMRQCQKAYTYLDGESEMSASLLLGKALQALQDISHISPETGSLYEQLSALEAELQEATYAIRRFVDQVDYSPEALEEAQSRLDSIYRLKQKYGNTIEDILDYKAQCEKELEELVDGENSREKLQKEEKELQAELDVLATALSKGRQVIASSIEKEIDTHLHDLQMPYAKFEVAINELDTFNNMGKNDVEFLIRTNLGEDMHPLSKIASGGEISRVMLAIKTVLVLGDVIDTVIFDEIDTGISGVAAQKVGEKLALIARGRQVLCITHLPQIAAMADSHFLIEKRVDEKMTTTVLRVLEEQGIQEELCRMMGGFVTENTLQGAKEIRHMAENYKKSLCG
ncbi:DNA repair protein RecN [Sporanaerobium hydrogeniformans]|uniref:DNA repair protein RecN n=1 Tax=Sporanaerobium hydrogeniformans TaxID=3072179 RepID=A0AC61DIL6_9FIRM|nr:DNA repair protein RecN [Sporanaerobium hydrogeniformans]PHV72371.1 DNA repair protein RecN [Sporanaerobium hydrogeniformans]